MSVMMVERSAAPRAMSSCSKADLKLMFAASAGDCPVAGGAVDTPLLGFMRRNSLRPCLASLRSFDGVIVTALGMYSPNPEVDGPKSPGCIAYLVGSPATNPMYAPLDSLAKGMLTRIRCLSSSNVIRVSFRFAIEVWCSIRRFNMALS